jgi:Ca2+:H+ antiporter
MMLIALGALLLPAFFTYVVRDRKGIVELSDGFAVILLAVYAAYLFFSTRPEGQIVAAEQIRDPEEGARHPWSPRVAVGVLLAATVGTGVLAEALVGTVEVVSHTIGLSALFVGVIVVPLVGNAAEHMSAVQLAGKGKVDVALAIAAGSSTQVALFVAPVLVLAGAVMGQPMDLVFHELEIVALAVAAGLFAFVSLDGESNWFEAVQLLALYLMVGVAFFFLPSIPGAH